MTGKMKKSILFIILFLSFFSTSHCQWWVSGGNLSWPFGKVSVTKYPLETDSLVSFTGTLSLSDKSRNSSLSLSGNNINFSTDSVMIPSADIFLQNSNDIWLGSLDNPFRIIDYDWSPVIIYDNNTHTFMIDHHWYNNTNLEINDAIATIKLQGNFIKLGNYKIYLGDYEDGNYGTKILLDDGSRSIYFQADSISVNGRFDLTGNLEANGSAVLLPNIPADSAGLSSGQLYFDPVSGILKRKF